jgi:hypothetical protein
MKSALLNHIDLDGIRSYKAAERPRRRHRRSSTFDFALRRAGLCTAILALAWPVASQAQIPGISTPPNGTTAFGGGDVSLPLSRYDTFSSTQTDVLFGRNSAGPYQLSWQNAHAGTESVVRNGTLMHPDTDYTINFSAGTLTFTLPLNSGEMARITYLCDTLDATPKPAVQTVPLQWDIWDSGQSHLLFSSLYRLTDTAVDTGLTAATPGTVVYNALQFTSATKILPGSTATSGLYLDIQDENWLQRGGWKVGDTTKVANNQLAFNYARAGSQFAQSNVTGITAGRELLEATDKITPLKAIELNLYVRQTTLLISSDSTQPNQPGTDVNGTITQEAGGKVAVALPRGTKITAAHTITDTTPTQSDGTLSVSDKVTVEATPVPRLAKLKLTTSLEDQYDKDGVSHNRSALIDLPPLRAGQLHLSGGVQQNSAPGKDLNVGLINATAHPLRYVELTGGARLRDGVIGDNTPDPNAVNTYTGSLALTPWKKIKLTSDLAHNPEGGDGTVQRLDRQNVGLQADIGLLSLHGKYGYENDYVNTRLTNTADIGLDLRVSRWDTLTTGFKLQSLYDKTMLGQVTYQVGYTHRMSSIFDLTLSGLYTTYDQLSIDPDRAEMKAQAKLGLHF